ncbi:MAG: cytochrome c oxidase subunit I [Acidimicrobiia bacterium]|nr:cytochrome c oxidase subunit I [Acidimicrobiia bacterium]
MAIVEQEPLALPAGTGTGSSLDRLGVLSRPTATTGWRSWISTVDHKKIGIMYGTGAMFFFLVGGIEALLIRVQLAQPDGKVLSASVYNQVYTMHGITMIFLVVMPLANAFANYLLPLQVGARDVAFPRLNALSFWIWGLGGLFLNSSWLFGGGADGGWFNYAPNSGVAFSPHHGIDFYSVGLQIVGIGSLISALNLIVTVINMRAPGMTLFRMPVFTWMVLVTQFLLLFALPVISVALFLLMFDRTFDANFFNVAQGADPLLWQHLFWIFGHPEVYILILPSFGIASEVIPVFSRKPIYGYPFMVFSGIAIGFMGWGVWAHHMFASGIGPISVAAFSISTMFIAVPTGVKILNWLATMWGGKIRFTTSMLFSVGLVTMFTIGGLSGVSHAVSPADTQQTDTYYIVAHFHYVIFGGALLGLFSGLYFWWPKAFGYMLNERIGKWHFWLTLIGFNLTFAPMHWLGLQGMSRRIVTYQESDGFTFWNQAATLGAFIIALSVLVLIYNVFASYAKWKKAERPNPGPDPWDARGLEWMVPSPTPEHNFDEAPVVHAQDDFWHRKYGEDEEGRAVRVKATEEVAQRGDAKDVHLPAPSYFPILLAASLPFIGYAVIFKNLWIGVPGVLLLFWAVYGWVFEPPDDPDLPHGNGHEEAGHGGGSDDGEPAQAALPEGAEATSEEAPVG